MEFYEHKFYEDMPDYLVVLLHKCKKLKMECGEYSLPDKFEVGILQAIVHIEINLYHLKKTTGYLEYDIFENLDRRINQLQRSITRLQRESDEIYTEDFISGYERVLNTIKKLRKKYDPLQDHTYSVPNNIPDYSRITTRGT